jgi:AraC family transcriptional activator of pobA
MRFEGINKEYIEILDIDKHNCDLLNESRDSELSLLWFTSNDNKVAVDTVNYCFNTNDLISLTEFHKIDAQKIHTARLIRWNRSFYCIVDHDSEVGCKGILYYGASKVPIIKPSIGDIDVLNSVLKMFLLEIESKDNLQLEMLQMMLKQLLILCTRIYKLQEDSLDYTPSNFDIIREYNFLVEENFRKKHSVAQYADLLFKSPKTLSNLFNKHGNTTPLQYIQNRIMLEARRLLTYTDKPISDIGYELGYPDIQAFSRFFKKQESVSPQSFREREI